MEEVKRLRAEEIARKLNMGLESEDFIFKPSEIAPSRHYIPHRSNLYGIGLIEQGSGEIKIGLDHYHFLAPAIICVGPDQIRQWGAIEGPISVTSLFFSEEFVLEGLSDALLLQRFSFFKNPGRQYLHLDMETFSTLKSLFNFIESKDKSRHPQKLKVIAAQLRVILYELDTLQDIQTSHAKVVYSRGEQLHAQFKSLLSLHFREHREVGYYADALFVTPKHLSDTIKKNSGKSAGELISEMVCLESKVLLQNRSLNISEVSSYLNFANPSFFGKYFKRYTGLSPSQYRETIWE